MTLSIMANALRTVTGQKTTTVPDQQPYLHDRRIPEGRIGNTSKTLLSYYDK